MLHLDHHHTQKLAAARHSSQARSDAQRSLQVGAGALPASGQPCGTGLSLGRALQVGACPHHHHSILSCLWCRSS